MIFGVFGEHIDCINWDKFDSVNIGICLNVRQKSLVSNNLFEIDDISCRSPGTVL